MRSRTTILATSALVALAIAAPARAAQVVAIEPSAEVSNFSPQAMNDARQIVGQANVSGPQRGVVWSSGNYRVLPPLVEGQGSTAARDINDAGEVGGHTVLGRGRATRWSPTGVPTDLGTLDEDNTGSYGWAIAPDGVVVGDSLVETPTLLEPHPVRFDGGPEDLTGQRGSAWDVNAGGDILIQPYAILHPVLLRSGTSTTLTCLASGDGGQFTHVLNDSGVVVERADENHELPRRWDSGTCTDMDLPAGTTDLIGVRAINNAGYAVGTVRTGDPIKAVMWRPDGSVVTLDSLLPAGSPWQLQFAQTINDRGDIAGIGLLDGVRTAFLFSNRTFVVNDASDNDDAALDGVCDADAETAGEQCTLRAAIEEVNETTDSEPVAITFAIPGTPTIAPGAALPPIRRPVMLDGRTQPGGGARIDGAGAGPDVDGLTLDREATGSEVHGLTVTRFDGHGLRVRANDAVVQGNVLGAPVACAAPCTLGNRGSGVLVDGVAGVVVGRSVQQLLDGASDAVAGEPNVIAHNGGDGVTVGSVGTNDGDDVAWNRFAGNAGLPIELGADGRTLNDDRDGDGGANELLNSPVVTAARIETRGGVRRLKGGGGLTGIPNRLPSVVLYATTACTDPARPSDLIPLGTATVLSGKLGLDAAGQGSWEADLNLSAQPADHVTLAAAAVTASGTTSESSNCVRDTDGDSLNDPWEEDGADPDGDGVVEVPLDDMGATVGRKDVFVEIDSMPANPVTETGLDLVRAAFADAPLENPDGTSGMQIHLDNGPGSEMTRPLDGGARRAWAGLSDHDVLTSDEPLDVRDLELGTDRASIEPVHAIKREHFRWSRRFFFHYLLSARAIRANGFLQTGDTVVRSTQSAFAIGTFQDDTAAIATYGGLEDDLRTPLAHAGLVMTGVGTMLGIGPGGGGDPFGGKPNYLSVANPLFTWGLVERGTDEVVFDYSRAGAPADAAAGGSLLPLDERHLDETRGVGATGSVTRYVSAFVCPPAFSTRPFEPRPELRKIDDLAGPVDWDCAGGPNGTDVQANVNFDLRPNYEAGSLNPIYSPLLPREDWTNLVLDGGAIGGRAQASDDTRHDGSRLAAAEDEEPVAGDGIISVPADAPAAAPVLRGDTAPPTVTLEAGEDGRVVATASDDRKLDALDVVVDGAVTIVAASGTSARHEVTLPAGPHTIEAFAIDWALQRSATATRTIGAGGGTPGPGPGPGGGPPPPPPGGNTAKTRLPFSVKALKVKRGAVRIPLRNANAFAIRGDVTLQKGKRRLGRAAFRIAARGRKTIKVKLSKAGRRALRGRRSAKVSLRIRAQGAGGRATLTRRVKLRR